MQTSAILLIASIGAISVLLMLYVYIFMFERRLFLGLWFIGWSIIAINYSLDAFFPDLLRQNHLILLLSLSSYFYANLLISWGTLIFLKIKSGISLFLSIGIIWLLFFVFFSNQNGSDLQIIKYTYLAIFALSFWIGAAMIMSAKRYGNLALFLGLLNIAWVGNTVIFSYILKIPQMAPYIVSQILLLFNAIGLIQLFFKAQKDEIERGMAHITYLTFYDELTGLYNKAYFDKKMQELEKTNDCLPISLLIGDMNGLKFVNDVFGHQEGDNWLKRIALIIQQSCRQNDIIARWGGDEFAIILPNTDKETALDIVHKISEACKRNQEAGILLSISLGAATKSDSEADLSKVLKEAEELMYEIKLIEGKKARCAIAETLDKLLQEKNYETKEHVERLESLAKEFAQILNFSKENLNNLVQATKLHDIGKIGIPEDIVLKETPLNESEWFIMRKHVEIGYRIAHASGEFAHLADIILYHHEWWDGQGYPQGLKGEEIPLLSRIISILDSFDVMTWQPYKPAKTINEALHELYLKAGTQLDPTLVPIFIKMMTNKSLSN
ncbi:diguanylate cyclase [Clostridium aminobutyricum]|uniref:Diguanylate cyclase n=1 Tax=Clostridium aminobutyricum TaxID=33953 RepID=A0A939D7P2_CLOAM|nr:HD domain-containing phosphohydrolase [Clostridium aminobutyricum]MBN7772626.1 diguanylate cyclase [Clostridium aminobutyricum]